MHPPTRANLALTYANDQQMDGAGAQLQRIYGIYAVSRFLRLPYFHSPVKKIGYQGLSALETNSSSPELELRYNDLFSIASDIELPRDPVIHYIRNPDQEMLERLQIAANTNGHFTLLRILYPYAVADRSPEIYRHVQAISPFPRTRSKVFRLALHVRRGEELVVDSERMLPNSYYVSCALQITGRLQKLDIPFVCELYTEVASKAFVVTPQHHGIEGRIPANVILDPRVNRLEDFEVIPNLARFVNGDPIETLRRMATADALVLSRSSYSYVAAILNAGGIVVYHPFWHPPLKEWLISGEHGVVSDAELQSRLECWKQERAASQHA
ncbi:MAG TPA: hypothetical protein VME43_30920 [Bryobacteraceae bacterium]|nr:hypothetical protein [Bryobacteraceae bacterium]